MLIRVKALPLVLLLALPALADGPVPAGSTDLRAMTAAQRLGINYYLLPAAAPATDLPAPPPGTLQLPKFIVREERQSLSGQDVMTSTAALRLARKAYISPLYQVTFGPLSQLAAYLMNPLALFGGWHPSDAEASALARQQRRLERLNDLDDLMGLESTADPKLKREFEEIRYDASGATR